MRLEHSVEYDAPLVDVSAMLSDPAFRATSSWAQDFESVAVSAERGVGVAWLAGDR